MARLLFFAACLCFAVAFVLAVFVDAADKSAIEGLTLAGLGFFAGGHATT